MSDDGSQPQAYTNVHRAFVQALLSRGTITFEDAQPLLAAIQTAANPERPTLPGDISAEDFEDFMSTIHSTITHLEFEIRSSFTQNLAERKRVYALVNTTSDAMTQMATSHNADEIAFVKRVLDAMFDTLNTQRAEVMAVTSMQALKLAKPPSGERRESQTQGAAQNNGLTMHQGERVLEDMVATGWFEKSEAGFYSLSQRGIMELGTWLVDMYNDQPGEEDEADEEPHVKIKSCAACREIVTVGQRCPNLPCNTRLHDHCVGVKFRTQQGREECPACKTGWVDVPPVGEKAARGRVRASAARSSRGGPSSNGRNGHAEEDSDDE